MATSEGRTQTKPDQFPSPKMPSIVNVFVVSPDTRSERRFDLHITVEQLKAKLELVTGIPVDDGDESAMETTSFDHSSHLPWAIPYPSRRPS